MTSEIQVVTDNKGVKYDLVYSPDDGGWYFQRHSDDLTSSVYSTEEEAREAMRQGWVQFG